MFKLRPKFFLAAAFFLTTNALPAVSFVPTSPLIQIGDDTDIFFDSYVTLGLNDNLYSSVNKVSATSINVTPGFTLEYAKDSPVFFTATAQRTWVSYYGGATLSRLNNQQDLLDGTIFIDQGGPLKVTLRSNYRESARNDNLTSFGISGTELGETLVRQGSYLHSIKADYRLTERLFMSLSFQNDYNRYLNPVKIVTENLATDTVEVTNNTNSLSEINTKTVALDFTYNTPGELITYGLSCSRGQNDFSSAPYYYKKTVLGVTTTEATSRDVSIYKSIRNYYGLTATGRLTRSGKLTLKTRFGFSSSTTSDRVSGESTLSGLAYDINLKHALTDLITHEIGLTSSTSPSPNGTDSRSHSYMYSLNYAAADNLSLNFHVSKSDVSVGPNDITSMDYNLGAMYNYNSHLNFSATLDVLNTSFPGSSSEAFQSKSFVLQATFRY